MSSQPPTHDRETAEELFEAFLNVQGGDTLRGLEMLCAEHPQQAAMLRELYAEWQDFAGFADGVRERYGAPAIDVDFEGDPSSSAANKLRDLQQRGDSRDRYRLRGELGRGGMGVVLRVWDDDLQRDLAMKILRRREGESGRPRAEIMTRFLAEAQITGQLEHPGVVPVHQIGINESGDLFFTMTMVRGRRLADILRLARSGEEGWNIPRVVGVLQKVCETLAYAHNKHVVHRDLKPANIMIGRFGEVYVMDWGLAKSGRKNLGSSSVTTIASAVIQTVRDHEEQRESSPWHTREGAVLGTPAYMSPEQAEGRAHAVGPRSDVYSVGAILYELLTGHAPFTDGQEGRSSASIIERLHAGPPTPVHRLARNSPPELIAICERAMARRAVDRHADMMEMAGDLRAFLENRVVRSHRTGALIELRKWMQRNRSVAVMAVTAILVSLVSVTALWAVQWRANRDLDARAAELDQARTSAETARLSASREATVLASVVTWMEDLFRLPSPDVARGRVVTARELIDNAAEDLRERGFADDAVKARLCDHLGHLYLQLGLGEEAAEFFDRTLAAEIRAGLPEADRLRTRMARAAAWAILGRLQDVEAELIALEEPVFRCPDLTEADRITLLADRASLDLRLGRNEEAEERLLHALERAAEGLDEDHYLWPSLRSCLGVVYQRWSRFDDAEVHWRQAHEDHLRIHGADHPSSMRSLSNLASLAANRGDHDRALTLYQQVAVEQERILGEDHPSTLHARRELAILRLQDGQVESAESILRDVVDRAERVLPPEDPDLWSMRNRLGHLLTMTAQWEEAETLLRHDLEERRRHAGPDSIALLEPLGDLAYVYLECDRLEEAEALTQEALRLQRRRGDRELYPLLDLLVRLSQIYSEMKQLGKAELVLEEAAELCDERLSAGDPATIRVLVQTARIHHEQDRAEDAELDFDLAAELARESLDPAHPIRRWALFEQGRFLLMQGVPEEALAIAEELLEVTPKRSTDRRSVEDLHQAALRDSRTS